jgi:hypothetical protein
VETGQLTFVIVVDAPSLVARNTSEHFYCQLLCLFTALFGTFRMASADSSNMKGVTASPRPRMIDNDNA